MGGPLKSGTWVYDKDLECLVPKYGRNHHNVTDLRSHLAAPSVHAGGMPTIKSMADGQHYETKRNYYKSVSRAGCEIIGFDKRWREHVKEPQPYGGPKSHYDDIVKDVKKAIEIETSKLPPAGTVAHRKLVKKQRRAARATT